MFFAAPIWLMALFPWLALSLWLLWGRRPRVHVPFLPLWQGAVQQRRARWSVQPPPVALAMALAAILLGILSAAGPVLTGFGAPRGPQIAIIIDRGLTMSARGSNNVPRFVEAADLAAPALIQAYGAGPVDLSVVPLSPTTPANRSTWIDQARALLPTAVDTRAMLASTVADRLQSTPGPVIVLTDQPLPNADPRVIVIPPQSAVQNVGIVRIAARPGVAPQLMVTVRNQSQEKRATLTVRTDNQSNSQTIDLPPQNAQANFFIDLPSLGRVIEADLDVTDDFPSDNSAWLVREGNWPAIEARDALPPSLQFLLQQYQRLQPPGIGSIRVAIVRQTANLASGEPGVILDSPVAQPTHPATRPLDTVVDHPVTAHVNWSAVLADAQIAPAPAASDWQPLVKSAGHLVVAVRSSGGARQLWIGFDSPTWPTSVDYVIFWKNVLDWVGQAGVRYNSQPAGFLPDQWRPQSAPTTRPALPQPGLLPGIYVNGDQLRAVNAADVSFPTSPAADWAERLKQSLPPERRGLPLRDTFILLAMVCVLVAALTWRRSVSCAFIKDLSQTGESIEG